MRNLEALLDPHGIAYPPPSQDFAISETIKPGINVPFPVQEEPSPHSAQPAEAPPAQATLDPVLREQEDGERLEKLVNDVGMVSVQGAGDARMLGSTTSGISFARVVFAAVKRSVNFLDLVSSISSAPSECCRRQALLSRSRHRGGSRNRLREGMHD